MNPNEKTLGPIRLAPGISRANGATVLLGNLLFVMLTSFVSFVQPYLFTTTLGIPADRQGVLGGNLSVLQETIGIFLYGIIGAATDRTGRRVMAVAGFAIMALGLVLYPLASQEFALYLMRAVVAVGTAVAASANLAAFQDYPQEISRAKFGAMNSIATGIGILLLSFVGVRLPQFYAAAGADAVAAGRYAFWTAAAIALGAAAIVRLGLSGTRVAGAPRKNAIWNGLADGVREGVRNPRLALAYVTSFAARGDLVVIGTFMSLWFALAGREQGHGPAEGLAVFGMAMGALQLAIFVWAPIFGWLLDRLNRVLGVAIAMTLAALGYFVVGEVANPLDTRAMLPAVFLLGIGEISTVIASNTLMGQEAPARIRGAVTGVFSACGTAGILFASLIGGRLFDAVGHGAPFTLMAAVNTLAAVLAMALLASKAGGKRI